MVHDAGKGRHEYSFEAALRLGDVGCQGDKKKIAAAQLVLGSCLTPDYVYKATAQVDGAQGDNFKLDRERDSNSGLAQTVKNALARVTVDKSGSDLNLMRVWDSSSGSRGDQAEIQAELRQAFAAGEDHPGRHANAQGRTAPSLHKFCSTLLRKIGPATNPARAEALAQATTRAEDADAKTVRKLALRLANMHVHNFGLPDHAKAQTMSCAKSAPRWQGQSPLCCSHPSGPERLRSLSRDLLEQLIFADEGSGGRPFHFLLGQAIHTRSSGSSHSAATGAATLVCPSSTHADPHPTVAPSSAIIFSWWVHQRWITEKNGGAGLISSSYGHDWQTASALISRVPS